jgi:hypothetical protein
MKCLPSEPEGIGVLYTNAAIIAEAARRDREDDSLLAESAGFNLSEYNLYREAA